MTAVSIILLLIFTRLAGNTDGGRWLHRRIVEWPIAEVERIERKHFLFLVVGFAAMYGLAPIVSADLAMIAAWDVTIYLDAALTVWSAAVLVRAKGGWQSTSARLAAMMSVRRLGPRIWRVVRTPTAAHGPKKAANDDPDPAIAWAA